jgi:iron(III) transport system ATP-binding protein
MTAPALALEHVSLAFGSVQALDEVSLALTAGEIIFLLGPSGSGKSSLLRVVAGLERPQRGIVSLGGVPVAGADVFVAPEHRRVGMVFQDYALFPHLTIAENVAFGLRRSPRDTADVVRSLLERLDISRYAASYPHMLSGGERQRVALARALAPQPQVLLMDEPFSSLDAQLRDRVRRETLDLLREFGTTTIVVSHDPNEALRTADRIALLRSGRLLQLGSADQLYSHPVSSFVARFLGDVNELSATCHHGRVETALGSLAAPHIPHGAAVRVCIRPQHLRVAPSPTDVRGRVIETEIRGEIERVTVAVSGLAAPVSLSMFGRAHLIAGDAVFLALNASSVVVVPDDVSTQTLSLAKD